MKLQEEQPCRSPRSIGHMAKVLSLPMRKVCVLPRSMVFLIGKGNPVSPPHTKREVPHAHQNSQLFARPRHFGGREYFCHDGVPGHPPGYPSPQAVDPEPDAHQNCHRNPAAAEIFQHTPSDPSGTAANRQPQCPECRSEPPGVLLHLV